jgi:hypothetical protein
MRRIDKWKRIFIDVRNRYSKGWAEINFFRYIIQMGLLIDIWLRSHGIEIVPMWFWIIAIITYFVLCWYIGYLWDKAHMYQLESEWGNKRNPFVKEMRIINKNGKIEKFK